ncbi:MAG: bi-domain-containing oxidoreductase [Gracilimonas sp.]
MKQILVKKGQILTEELPEPPLQKGMVKIQVYHSCISAGTELSNIYSSGAGILQRVIEKPETIKRAFSKVSKMGLKAYWNSVQTELNEAKPSGYSLSGKIIEVGDDINTFKKGDLVAAAGGIVAAHAEIAVVPKNLVVPIPEEVSTKDASTVAIGGIALQGIRRANLEFGSNVAVIGTGLLGLITIQLLKAHGIRVIGIDIDEDRLKLAKKCGADKTYLASNENLIDDIIAWADGQGVDASIITASSSSAKPLSQAFQICRKKGAVVLVGVTGMEINRKDIYQKELDFFISTSYGPGRYDDSYEKEGVDYPYGYVRWTENRNMRAYLWALSDKSVNLDLLSQAEFSLEESETAFEQLKSNDAPLISFFTYDSKPDKNSGSLTTKSSIVSGKIKTAVIGTGNFAVNMTIPNLKKLDQYFSLDVLVNRTPYKAKNIAEQIGIKAIESSADDLLTNHNIDAVFITTRHGSHADLVLKFLKAGKHVFVEKPLAVNQSQLDEIKEFFKSHKETPVLTVGFNRRFSPFITTIHEQLKGRIHPIIGFYRMNAGFQPEDHWTHKDGGRIIGEGCHIIDLFEYLTGHPPQSISVDAASSQTPGMLSSDNRTITVSYRDGSVCTLIYTGQGSKKLSKEYLEIHFDGKSIILDNYYELLGFGVDFPSNLLRGDKGHEAIIKAFALAIKEGNNWPIPLESLFNTSNLALLSSR